MLLSALLLPPLPDGSYAPHLDPAIPEATLSLLPRTSGSGGSGGESALPTLIKLYMQSSYSEVEILKGHKQPPPIPTG